jgi:imidazolonepropionase-like amidohydrolase
MLARYCSLVSPQSGIWGPIALVDGALRDAINRGDVVGPRMLVAGAASIEHGTLMDDEGRSLMKQHGTYLVPTLEVSECVGTSYPAEFVVSAKLGSIEPGKLADLITVRGAPLTNVRLLDDVRFVMQEGQVFKQD